MGQGRVGGSGRLSYWYFRKQAVLDGVGVSLFSRSSAHFPHQLQPLSRFSQSSLFPLPLFLHRCRHAVTHFSHCPNKKLGDEKLYPQTPLCFHAICCFKSKSCSDYAADSIARPGRPWLSCRNHAFLPNSTPAQETTACSLNPSRVSHQSFPIHSVQRGCMSFRPLSPFSC